MRLLSLELACKCFLEPEEGTWPSIIRERERFGYFNSIHAFRSLRLPGLFDARAASEAGEIVLLDSYYDKLCAHWIGRPGTEWLIKPDDPYFPNFQQTAWLDYKYLPDADVVVVFKVQRADWTQMVVTRGRQLDVDSKLLDTFDMQGYFLEAAKRYVHDRLGATKLIEFDNVYGDPRVTVDSLCDRLKALGAVK